MQGVSSLTSRINASQIALQEQIQNGQQQQMQMNQIQPPDFDQTSHHDDFFDQMLSTLPPSWSDLASNPKSSWDLNPTNPNTITTNPTQKRFNISHVAPKPRDLPDDELPAPENLHYPYDDSSILASRLQQHHINGNSPAGIPAGKSMLLQLNRSQQLLVPRTVSGTAGDSGLIPLPLTLGSADSSDSRLLVDRSRDEVDASFKSPNTAGDCSVQNLYNGFAGSLPRSNQTVNQQHFHHTQPQNFISPANGISQSPATGSPAGGTAPVRQRVRARRGQATDPHSIAERLRRERIADRMKALQELVPNANKTDKASMLDEIIDYVKFLQLQVKVLSMSRLGGAGAVAPLVADISLEGGRGGDCIQAGGMIGRTSNGVQTATNDNLTVTEHQVAKLMEEDMGSAMQYLQRKGLCLMPISLATAISTTTCHSRNPGAMLASNLEAPSSPSMSVLTAQSAMGNGGETDVSRPSVKDAASVSKP